MSNVYETQGCLTISISQLGHPHHIRNWTKCSAGWARPSGFWPVLEVAANDHTGPGAVSRRMHNSTAIGTILRRQRYVVCTHGARDIVDDMELSARLIRTLFIRTS